MLSEFEIKAILRRAIKRCPLSAEEVAERLGIGVSMLRAYTAKSKLGYRFPASLVIPFCEVTGDSSLLQHLCLAGLKAQYFREFAEAVAARLERPPCSTG